MRNFYSILRGKQFFRQFLCFGWCQFILADVARAFFFHGCFCRYLPCFVHVTVKSVIVNMQTTSTQQSHLDSRPAAAMQKDVEIKEHKNMKDKFAVSGRKCAAIAIGFHLCENFRRSIDARHIITSFEFFIGSSNVLRRLSSRTRKYYFQLIHKSTNPQAAKLLCVNSP